MKEHEQLKGSGERILRIANGEELMAVYGPLAGESVEIAWKCHDADAMHVGETVQQLQSDEVQSALSRLARLSEYGGGEFANHVYRPEHGGHYIQRRNDERTVVRAAIKALGWEGTS